MSFPVQSDKLVVGRHLLLSPVSAVVKPTCSVFVRRPNQIHEGE